MSLTTSSIQTGERGDLQYSQEALKPEITARIRQFQIHILASQIASISRLKNELDQIHPEQSTW